MQISSATHRRIYPRAQPVRTGLLMCLGTGTKQRLRIGAIRCHPARMKKTRAFQPRAIGEIAIRCKDLRVMADFYENTIGLERLSGGDQSSIIFLRIADGFAGHTAVLALFSGAQATTGESSSLHHLALSLPYDEQDAVMDWYEHLELPYRVEHFDWIGWRGIFTQDPEGNTVELVAFDPRELKKRS